MRRCDDARSLETLASRGRSGDRPLALAVAEVAEDGAASAPAEGARRLALATSACHTAVDLSGGQLAMLVEAHRPEDAAALLERLRARLASRRDGAVLAAGVSDWSADGDSGAASLARSVEALALARSLGGNQVRLHSEAETAAAPSADEARFQLLLGLAEQVERREAVESRHSRAVAVLARALALELGLRARAAWRVYLAGLVHDVGKVTVPDRVLRKPADLDSDEWALIRAHPLHGAEIVTALGDPVVAPIVAAQHERLDGGGYPHGLAGTDIPPEARVLAVANALVSMAGERRFRPALPLPAAVVELARGSSSRYDPGVVGAALELCREGRLFVGWRGQTREATPRP